MKAGIRPSTFNMWVGYDCRWPRRGEAMIACTPAKRNVSSHNLLAYAVSRVPEHSAIAPATDLDSAEHFMLNRMGPPVNMKLQVVNTPWPKICARNITETTGCNHHHRPRVYDGSP